MRALLLSPDNSVELDIELPETVADQVQVVLSRGQVFHKLPLPHGPTGVPAYQQVPFISLDPEVKAPGDLYAAAVAALEELGKYRDSVDDALIEQIQRAIANAEAQP